jgi:hypothetical protein
MNDNPHFEKVASWKAARKLLDFEPLVLENTKRQRLQSLYVYVRDHKQRELPAGNRSLEAYFDGFVFTQKQATTAEAHRLALSTSYGLEGRDTQVATHPGRLYELGPVPPPDDIDGRSPAVVVWHDGRMFYLIASTEKTAAELLQIAQSLYGPPSKSSRSTRADRHRKK